MRVKDLLGTVDYHFDEVSVDATTYNDADAAMSACGDLDVEKWDLWTGVDGYGDPTVSIEIWTR